MKLETYILVFCQLPSLVYLTMGIHLSKETHTDTDTHTHTHTHTRDGVTLGNAPELKCFCSLLCFGRAGDNRRHRFQDSLQFYQLHRYGGSRVTAVRCTADQQVLPSVGETCPPGPPAHMHGEVFQERVSQESRKRSELSFRN